MEQSFGVSAMSVATPAPQQSFGVSALSVAIQSCFYCLLFCLSWVAFVIYASQQRRKDKKAEGIPVGTWALKVLMLVHHLLVGPAALGCILTDHTVMQAFFCRGDGCQQMASGMIRDPNGPNQCIMQLVPITLGYMMADLCLISNWEFSGQGGRQEAGVMIVHHVLCLLSWPFALVFDFCARYVLIFLAYEVSSIFLVYRWMLSASGKKSSPRYFWNGVLFTCSFILLRMVAAIPQLLALHNAMPWAVDPGIYHIFWWMPYGSTWLVLPHFLNFFWGTKVILGAAALLRGGVGAPACGESCSEENGAVSSPDRRRLLDSQGGVPGAV